MIQFFLLISFWSSLEGAGWRAQNHGRITPSSVLKEYPELKGRLRPERLSYLFGQLPYQLWVQFEYMSVTILNGQVTYRCQELDSCPYGKRYVGLISKYAQSRKVKMAYLLFVLRDQLHMTVIRNYLLRERGTDLEKAQRQPQFNQTLQHYGDLVQGLPLIMQSIDLSNRLEKSKFLIPDPWMLFNNFDSIRFKVQEISHYLEWDFKLSKIFWRGDMSGKTYDDVDYLNDTANYFQRMELIRYSAKYPSIVDAKFNRFPQQSLAWMIQQGLGDQVDIFVSPADHVKYKYLISIDGWTCAWVRPCWILASNCLLLKQESPKVEWFYYRLHPYRHYYPVANNLSDLLDVFSYLQSHQEEAQKITKQANQFVRQNFKKEDIEIEFFQIMDDYIVNQNVHWSVFEAILQRRSMEEIHYALTQQDRTFLFSSPQKDNCYRLQADFTVTNRLMKLVNAAICLYFTIKMYRRIKLKHTNSQYPPIQPKEVTTF